MATRTIFSGVLVACSAVVIGWSTYEVRAATVTLQDWGGGYQGAADTWLDSHTNKGDDNYGNSTTLEIHYSSVYASESAIIRFDLSPIPANAVITGASLSMSYGDGALWNMSNSDWLDLSIWRIKENQSWTEGTGGDDENRTGASWYYRYAYPNQTGWYNAGALGGSAYATADATTRVYGNVHYGWVTWTSSAMKDTVAAWYNHSAWNNGWVIFGSNASDNSNGVEFRSSEHGAQGADWAYRPKLVVEYQVIPDPATVLLISLGGLGLRRRTKR